MTTAAGPAVFFYAQPGENFLFSRH